MLHIFDEVNFNGNGAHPKVNGNDTSERKIVGMCTECSQNLKNCIKHYVDGPAWTLQF